MGSSASIERTREWASAEGGSDSADASIGTTGSRAAWDWSLAADHSELRLDHAAASDSLLADDECEGTTRLNSAAGDQLVADLTVQMAEGGDAKAMSRLDLATVIAFHPNARAQHSLVYLVWATTQPYYPLPPIAPGIAYCYSSADLTLAIGLPFSALEWKLNREVMVSASVADSIRTAIAWHRPRWEARMTAAWTTASYRVNTDGRGPVHTWEEAGFGADLGCKPFLGTIFRVRGGRQVSRRLVEESGHVLWDAGPAWTATAMIDVNW
jgi:hypothetical protein